MDARKIVLFVVCLIVFAVIDLLLDAFDAWRARRKQARAEREHFADINGRQDILK